MSDPVRTEYRVLSEGEKAVLLEIKGAGSRFLDMLTKLGPNRELSLAKTKVEEAVMWAVKGVTG